MTTTYLGLINKALRELREKPVTDLSADYTLYVGQKVNQAKREVEDSWNWKELLTEITFSTVAGTESYSLGTGGVGTGGPTTERSVLLMDDYKRPMIFNLDEDTQLWQVPLEVIRGESLLNQSDNSKPTRFALTRSNVGWTIRIYPKPDAVYAMSTAWKIPQDDFTTATTVLSIPSDPVYLRAAAYLAAERGDGQGEEAGRLMDAAGVALSNAIQFEAEPGELTLYVT